MSAPEQPPAPTIPVVEANRTPDERRLLIESVAQALGETFDTTTPGDMYMGDMLHALAVFALGACLSMDYKPAALVEMIARIQTVSDRNETPPVIDTDNKGN